MGPEPRPPGAEQRELSLSLPPPPLPPPGAEQREQPLPLPPPPPGAEQRELPLSLPPPSPPPPAEGECLLVPPPPPREDCLPLPPPPTEGECLLVEGDQVTDCAWWCTTWALGPAQGGPGIPAGCPGVWSTEPHQAAPDWIAWVVVEVSSSPPPPCLYPMVAPLAPQQAIPALPSVILPPPLVTLGPPQGDQVTDCAWWCTTWALGPAQGGPGIPAGCPGVWSTEPHQAAPDWIAWVVVEVSSSPPPPCLYPMVAPLAPQQAIPALPSVILPPPLVTLGPPQVILAVVQVTPPVAAPTH
ncbi:UNVERIFIED_CONTAM: hypothetical protein FKN15_013036 [Acipenser sinensis]